MKRAQITIFVIIGLAVLLIVGLFIMMPKRETTSVTAQQDAALVTAFVQQCLNQVGEETITQVSAQGGYWKLNTLKDAAGSADSQVITIAPQKIAIWHEVHACAETPAGCVSDNRPPLCARDERNCPVPFTGEHSIQESIEQGVEERLLSCLNGFVQFEQVEVSSQGEPRVEVAIRNNDVSLLLNYPIEITAQDNQQVSVDEFATSLDVALPSLYLFAYKIQQEQQERKFLEEAFLHLLSISTGIDQPLPPFRDLQIQGGQKFWITRNVQRTIEDGLMPFMEFVQIQNAVESYVPLQSPDTDEDMQAYADGVLEYLAVNIDNRTYPYGVRFEYPRDTLHVDINGKEVLKPRTMPDTGVLKMLGIVIYDYRFRYNIAFPMNVEVRDPAAFNGRGLSFNFGVEANIKNNQPLNTSIVYNDVSFSTFDIDLSDPSQLVNHVHEITVTDARTDEPIAGASIVYACNAEYHLGITNAAGKWSGKAPYCATGGAFIAMADGYARDGVALDNVEDDGASSPASIELWPLREITLKVYKLTELNVSNISQNLGAREQLRTDLTTNDSLVVTISKNKELMYEDALPLEGTLSFGGDGIRQAVISQANDFKDEFEAANERDDLDDALYAMILEAYEQADALQTAEENTSENAQIVAQRVTLVPGKYDIDGMLVFNGILEINSTKRCVSMLGGIKEECSTLEAQNFTGWLSGGMVLMKGQPGPGPFEITPEMLYSHDTLVLYALEMPLPKNWDDLEKAKPIAEYQLYAPKNSLVLPAWEE